MTDTNVKTAGQTCDCILHRKQKIETLNNTYATRNQKSEPRF